MELHEQIEKINSKEDLADFVAALRRDLNAHPDEWENATLDRFLAAMTDWMSSMDDHSRNTGRAPISTPSWKTFADILYAAKIYE